MRVGVMSRNNNKAPGFSPELIITQVENGYVVRHEDALSTPEDKSYTYYVAETFGSLAKFLHAHFEPQISWVCHVGIGESNEGDNEK